MAILSKIRWAGLLIIAWPVVGFARAEEVEPLPPPFRLQWGDSPARLVVWARRSKLDQTVHEPGGNPQLVILKISSADGHLPGHDASELEARFFDGRLYEVSLHYPYPGKRAGFVKGKFVELKRILTRHGQFRPNGKRRDLRDGVLTESEAFQVNPGKRRSLIMTLTEVRDAKRGDAAAMFSVIYHNDLVLMESEEGLVIDPKRPRDAEEGQAAPGPEK